MYETGSGRGCDGRCDSENGVEIVLAEDNDFSKKWSDLDANEMERVEFLVAA